MKQKVYCIPCRRFFTQDSLCDHLWWCDAKGEFLGGGDVSAPCSDADCKGCRAAWLRFRNG